MWPDWAIFCTLGNFLRPLATINFPKSSTFLGNFFEVVKIYHICSGIIFGQLLWTFGNFFLVTLRSDTAHYLKWVWLQLVESFTEITVYYVYLWTGSECSTYWTIPKLIIYIFLKERCRSVSPIPSFCFCFHLSDQLHFLPPLSLAIFKS